MSEFVPFKNQKERTDHNVSDGEFPTDVENIKANGEYNMGLENFPIFDVDYEDFARSSQGLRNKVQWNTINVRDYSEKSGNGRHFYIRYNNQIKKIK